jgi:hypothetical protein
VKAKNKREARFIGHGNHWNGQYRGWQIKCGRCQTPSKVIAAHGSSVAPHMIVRKLQDAGWIVGNDASRDLCTACQKKDRQKSIGGKYLEEAKSFLRSASAGMVETPNSRIHFDELVVACRALDATQAKVLIAVLRERIPKREFKATKYEAPKEPDSEYEKWLNEQVG